MCELCKIWNNPKETIITKVYYKGKDLIILDCKTCNIPMGIWKEHDTKNNDNKEIKKRTREGCKKLFGNNIKFRWKARKILDHQHFHILNAENAEILPDLRNK